MVETLWKVFLIVLLVIGILTLIKSAIEVWFIKPIVRKKKQNELNKSINELVDILKEDLQKENIPKKSKKPIKKTTKKEDK